MIRRAVAVAVVAVLLLLGACSGERTVSVEVERPTGPAVGPQYVALGDSFAAAPGVPSTSGADGCFRSDSNYAQLVAAATELTVTDVTCSGATTATLLEKQVPAITSAAELVTVGVGGNDLDLFTTLVRQCSGVASSDLDGAPCTEAYGANVPGILATIDDNLTRVFDAIATAAPQARVVVVGYPDLLPPTGSCPDLVTLAPADYPLFNQVSQGLSDLLQAQAEQRDFDFVDLTGPSRGHDICSDEPWINGQSVAADGTIPFHPFAVEQQAVADLVTGLL